MVKKGLSEDEVYERVLKYTPAGITDELYKFGMMMLTENLDRTKQLDSKATILAGYSGAIIAFLVSRQSLMEPATGWQVIVILLAGLSALVAVIASIWALQVRTFRWFSDRVWFKSESGILEDVDRLRRYYVLEMHHVNHEIGQSNGKKADRVVIAQRALGIAGLCLAAAFLIPVMARLLHAMQ